MRFRIINEKPRIYAVVFETGDELATKHIDSESGIALIRP